jgi:prepilin-type N-terminal cleavage/methylation domain-containing protein
MNVRHAGRGRGFSLIEAMIAIAVVSIAALGSLAYQYLGAKQLKIARAEFAATRIGQMVIEDWKSAGAVSNYDPAVLGSGFINDAVSGGYVVAVDGITFYIAAPLVSSVVDTKPFAGTLRQIIVTVRWRNDFSPGVPTANDPALVFTTYK